MKLRDDELLKRVARYCKRVSDYLLRIETNKETFLADPMIQDACCMCIVQIGELSSMLSDEMKQKHPEIPWRAIKDTRNFYVHNYGNVDLNYVWNTMTNDIPVLQRWCESQRNTDNTESC